MTSFSMDAFRLDDQVVVVTGGAGIYGSGFCAALAAAGATVVITSRRQETAEEAARAITTTGGRASGLALDQADPESVSTFAATLRDRWGRVDVLVNNAVHRAGGGLFDTTAEDWDATSAVNSRGLFLISQSVAAIMVEQRSGSIINIGSIYGMVSPDFTLYEGTPVNPVAFYSYDKGGMIGFTRFLAGELGPYGIRVNCLCPGGYNPTGEPSAFDTAYAARTPLQRMATGHDASGACVFLASPAAAYVTGAVIPVDGGWTSR
ncbi:SDR family NAD(P)-dependent oxidoreductase [Microlunatus sp. Y2014]|uniref:SDR family NAD(P)-dependent oxidoreductase n=1 Tax=Microlunatus sp. Y2014 TaxID=3418488 RepID=UPI003DA79E36